MACVRLLTAETPAGRDAIRAVMQRSYQADLESVPPAWALARVVDDVPVAFALIDPKRTLAFPNGSVPFAFLCDTATRKDRRREGHFSALMAAMFARIHVAGIPLALTHGRYQLYRQFGFEVFTHHSGIFITPEQIERRMGLVDADSGRQRLVVQEWRSILSDVLLVADVSATTWSDYRAALQGAALLAREMGKQRILFEHPTAPSYGSHYPQYQTLETPLTTLAQLCGADVRVMGAGPESGRVPDADWIKVLDVAALLDAVLAVQPIPQTLPKLQLAFETEVGVATLDTRVSPVQVVPELISDAFTVHWQASAIAQLVTGYASAEALCLLHNTPIAEEGVMLLNRLFPKTWRLSRNESWTYKA